MLAESQIRREGESDLDLRLGKNLAASLFEGLKVLREAYPELEEEQISLPINKKQLMRNLDYLMQKLSELKGKDTTAVKVNEKAAEKIQEENSVSLLQQTEINFNFVNRMGDAHIVWYLNGDGSDIVTSTKIRVKDFIFLYNPHRAFELDHVPIHRFQINRVVKGQEIPYTPVIISGEAHFREIDRRFASLLHEMSLTT